MVYVHEIHPHLQAAGIGWPDKRIQCCLFHVCRGITTVTDMRPRLEAGKQLRKLHSRVTTQQAATAELVTYNQWEHENHEFLNEHSTYTDGIEQDTH